MGCLATMRTLQAFPSSGMIEVGQWFERRKPNGSLVIHFPGDSQERQVAVFIAKLLR
jgi:hypothetical protein